MGRLTIPSEVCAACPDVIVMVLGHLEREHTAYIRHSWLGLEDDTANFWIDGEGIPPGVECFQVSITQVVPGVVRLGIVT
jgi:hypothetical protein